MNTRSRAQQGSTQGFTLIELMIVVAIIGLLMALLMPALSTAMRNSRMTHDKVVVKGIGQGLGFSSRDYDGQFVRPSLMIRMPYIRRGTNYGYQPGKGLEAKQWDATENIYNALIMSEYLLPEALSSPVDSNPLHGIKGQAVETDSGDIEPYQFDAWNPGGAGYDPEDGTVGFLDPNFSGQLDDDQIDHCSYATQTLAGNRYRRWNDRNATPVALIATRGTTESGNPGDWAQTLTDGLHDIGSEGHSNSSALEMLGPENTWVGHVATSDGKVDMIENYFQWKHYAGIENSGGSLIAPNPDNGYDCEFGEEWIIPGGNNQTGGYGAADTFLAFTNNNNADANGSWGINDGFSRIDDEDGTDYHRYKGESLFLRTHCSFDFQDE